MFRDLSAEVAEPVEERGLETAEAEFQARQGRLRQRLPAGVSATGEAVQGRAPWVAEPEHARRLVESLAGGVVPGPAEHLEAAVLQHPDQVRMGAAHHQSQERRRELRPAQQGRIDVAPEVVDTDDRLLPGRTKAASQSDSDQEAADQARTARHADPVDSVRFLARLLQNPVDQAGQLLEMVAGGQLGHHTAELAVQRLLGVDQVRDHLAPVSDEGDRSLVAAGLDAERQQF